MSTSFLLTQYVAAMRRDAQEHGASSIVDARSLSSTHVARSQYIPDWRHLLRRPKKGLALLRSLVDAGRRVVVDDFLCSDSSAAFRETTLRDVGTFASVAEARSFVDSSIAAGFNYPPSQNQLHLQYILPPFYPFHMALFDNKGHFTHGRFFPLEFVERALLAIDAAAGDEDFDDAAEST